jgi:uncharacterized membrane protein
MESFGMTGRDDGSTGVSETLGLQPRQTHAKNVGTIERWGSVIGGTALTALGLKRRSLGGVALAFVGAGLLYRGVTGQCQLYRALGINTAQGGEMTQRIKAEKAITVNKSPAELYHFWRHFENLPRFMAHLKSVQSTGPRRSHWIANAPMKMTAEWDAEITEERENALIAWRSLEGSRIPNEGSVRFHRAAGGRGTEVRVTLAYRPPIGKLGAAIAKLFGEEPGQQLAEDLRRFKSLMETGEIPTIEGQPSLWVSTRRDDRTSYGQRSLGPSPRRDMADEASGAAFPASDPRAWALRTEGT